MCTLEFIPFFFPVGCHMNSDDGVFYTTDSVSKSNIQQFQNLTKYEIKKKYLVSTGNIQAIKNMKFS